MSCVLVLGGYGNFGGRIARRLAAAGHEVIVAGRDLERARDFCADTPGLAPMQLDRSDIAEALHKVQPAVLIDASGPFQAQDHSVAQACIAARVHYCDIADGREFVIGSAQLDGAAHAAGVTLLSGASSVPALSGAVLRELDQGLDRIRAVEMAISASNRASVGPSVAAAILGQIGQPMSIRRGGRTVIAHGWQEPQCLSFSVAGATPIHRRWVALANVPDLALVPDRLRATPAVSFRAGTELAYQNLGLWLASWLIRWRCVSSLSRFQRALGRLQRVTASMGSDRSAMQVSVFGDRDGVHVERRWTLIAERGDGPEIPALAVPLLVARLAAGSELPGARDAGLALSLADFESEFAQLAIHHAQQEILAPPVLYRRVMGAAFETLAPRVREMHGIWRDGGAEGEAEVIEAANALGRLVARVMAFPPPGKTPLHVAFSERDGLEHWIRDFGGHRFSSRLSQSGGRLVEQFGPLRFAFELTSEEGALAMHLRSWSFLRIPLPLILAPRTLAREYEAAGRFHFDVPIALPLIGRVVHYRGWLRPIGS